MVVYRADEQGLRLIAKSVEVLGYLTGLCHGKAGYPIFVDSDVALRGRGHGPPHVAQPRLNKLSLKSCRYARRWV